MKITGMMKVNLSQTKFWLRLVVCYFVIFSIHSCISPYNTSDHKYLTHEELYAKAYNIEGKRLSKELFSTSFFAGYYTPNGLLGRLDADKKLIYLLDTNDASTLASGGAKGRGHYELLGPNARDYISQSGTFFLQDLIKSTVVLFKYDNNEIKAINNFNIKQKSPGCVIQGFKALSDSVFVIKVDDVVPPYSCYLSIVNSRNETLDSLQIYELDSKEINHSLIRQLEVSIALSPNRKNLIVCNGRFNHLTKYGLDDNKFSMLKKRIILEPKASIRKGRLKRDDEHIDWYGEVFTSEKYIYIVSNPEMKRDYIKRLEEARANGRRMSELMENSYILVFDYDFNFVKSFKCDDYFRWIAIAPDEKTVYASTYRDGQYIVKYKLEGL